MTENICALRAPRWRVLLNTLAFCAALGVHAGSTAAASTALAISGTPAASVTAGSTFTFKPTISGGTGKTVYFGITNKPSWAGFSNVSGTLTGKPTAANVGTTSGIVIEATNGTQWASTQPFAVRVVAGSSSTAAAGTGTLKISGTPAASVTAGSTFTFKPTISGGTGKTVYFGITNKPSWAGFSNVSGTLTGKPTAANVGTTSGIVIEATNGTQWASTQPFAVRVVAGSSSTAAAGTGTLKISGTPAASVTAGSTFTFKPTISGGTGKTVYFGITNKPSWAGFSNVSGTLTGTPTAANVGTTSGIVIEATNGTQWANTAAFAVKVVAAGGSTPTVTISGTPATAVTAGSKYSFQPSAKDSAGKALSYSVQHAPSWASFSIASGLLSGTPTSSQTGVYSGVIISASDGTASSALPAFGVTVKSLVAATGSATLNWVDPSKNTDGTPLTNLAGMNIHYGTSPSNLSQVIQVSGAGQLSYTIANLTAGTWYFGAAAYTTTGVEGMMSAIESKAIP